MLKNRRRRRTEEEERPRRQEEIWRPWFRVEYVLFLVTLAVAVMVTLGIVGGFWLRGQRQKQNEAEARANQQEYVKYFRHVVDGDNSAAAADPADGSTSAKGEEKPTSDTRMLLDVDIEKFKDDTGLPGELYALKDKYPQEVETILSWFEYTKLCEGDEWTTVGEAYPDQAIPERLLKLAVTNEETISVVAQYPYRAKELGRIDLDGELGKSDVPLLLQWDPRWAFEPYGDGMLCYTGCGPTCLAMVALHLKQDSSINPVVVARYADSEGYYTDGVGSAWTLMSDGSWHFGLTAEEISVTKENMVDRLEQGKPLIAAVKAGDFTQGGHFIVISGYREGSFVVNDPNSPTLSAKKWSFDRLASQIRVMWAFSRSGEG